MTEQFDVPLEPAFAQELVDFWTYIFNDPPDTPHELYLGSELEHNDTSVFTIRDGGELTATCTITAPKAIPGMADLGAVATRPEYRNRGLATRVCGTAVEHFFEGGGEATFVGTGGGAARVYERLGYRKLPGTQWWIRVADGGPPEAFLVDYFRKPATSVTVRPASPAHRIPMIPLMASPHRWRVLDANAGIFSSAYVSTGSFTHYLRYTQRVTEPGGALFAAEANDGRVVGLSSALPITAGSWRVEGFTQSWFADSWTELMEAAVSAAAEGGADRCYIDVAFWDEEKVALLESIGFRNTGAGDMIDLSGEQLSSTRLVREV